MDKSFTILLIAKNISNSSVTFCNISGQQLASIWMLAHNFPLKNIYNLQFVCRFQQILSCKWLASSGMRLKSIILQSKSIQKPVNLFHKSSNAKRKGNSQLKDSGHVSLPTSVTCDCICTCGDPLPPKPVRRVMFSDDTCQCDSADNLKSLPVFNDPSHHHDHHHPPPSSSSSSGASQGGCLGCSSSRFETREDERRNNEFGFSSLSPVPNNHYKSPHEVDGEYSYAYRLDPCR